MTRPFYEDAVEAAENVWDTAVAWVDEQFDILPSDAVEPTKPLPIKLKGNLQYPLDNSHGYGARISFQQITKDDNVIKAINQVTDITGNVPGETGSGRPQTPNENAEPTSDELAMMNGTYNEPIMKPITTDARRVTMYLPTGLNTNDRVNWEGQQFSALEAAKVQGISRIPESQTDIKKVLKEMALPEELSAENLSRLWNAGKNSSPKQAGAGALLLADWNTNLVKQGARLTLNPNYRVMFEQGAPRTFQFEFKFIAQSQEEYREIRSIIYYFRHALYPDTVNLPTDELGLTEEPVGILYKYPDPFLINVYYINNNGVVIRDIVPKFKTCQLQACSVSYNSKSMAMHDDGAFVEIDMNLSFIETSALNKKDIEFEEMDQGKGSAGAVKGGY